MTQPSRGMVPKDLTRMQLVGDPHVSPDGSRVAFVVTTMSEERDEYLSNIRVVDTHGGEPRRFTTGPKRDTSPRWSPDGSRLAFVSEREPKKKAQLYVMPAAGGEPVRLTDLKQGVSTPVWSPDGKRLAFVSRVGGGEDDEPDKPEDPPKSKPARVITSMQYKSNGEGFVYDRRLHVFVVDATGGEPRQLTSGDFADSGPAWSPDGATIAFVSARHDDRDYDNGSDIWLVAVEGGEPRRVTDTLGPVASPSFAPDGRSIAYLGQRGLNEAGRNNRLFVISVEGGTAMCVTEGLDRMCEALGSGLVWSPDGGAVTFGVEDRGSVAIYRAAANGASDATVVVRGERQLSGLSASRDGATLVYTAVDPVNPAEVFISDADGSGERPLTDLNRAWKSETALSRPERLRCERDGFDIDVWVMKPADFEPDKRYPVLLNVHGGPHTQYGWTFFDEFQVQSGAGYAVVFTNPRGSQGYGERFTRAVVGDWGGGDYLDVMAGLDTALAQCDFLDPDRLGVLGGSYGGFMTSWIVGHSHRFKAACSERAVNNVHTLFGTSDIGHSFSEAQSGFLPWDNPQWYVDHSPLTYAKEIKTPLLIIHSEDDWRCPIEQAEQLFVALKKQRKETLFIRFPGETHEMSRSGKPRHRLERFQYILDWFNRYLKPKEAVS